MTISMQPGHERIVTIAGVGGRVLKTLRFDK